VTRRTFLATAVVPPLLAAEPLIIDIHQHTAYSGRSNEELIQHQRDMGVSRTVLLPAGRAYSLAVGAGGNDSVVALARQYPKEYVFFANELPDIPETKTVLEKYLNMGAIGIGEQKFYLDCDSKYIDLIADIATHYQVPVLQHFEFGAYNLGFEKFYKILERHPKVNFIGHAQTFWGNIDKNLDQKVLYPKTKVTPGGLTDRWLSDYPNLYADMSAGSGLNALLRDEDNARQFLQRHQDKLIYGSDCNDRKAGSAKCTGLKQIETIKRLSATPAIAAKIFNKNARKIMKV
jgi:uncharacterized protein